MMKTLKVIAALLHYPEQPLAAYRDELLGVVRAENQVSERAQAALAGLVDEFAATELLDLQARYVATFDRGRALSLHLFEHVHGESRDRGQAMVDLLEVYKAGGFELTASELPDYIPLFLEFCSTLPSEQALGWMAEVGHIFQLLHARLSERQSPWAALFEPLLELAGAEAASAEVRAQVQREGRDDTPEELDKAWEEEPISFSGMPGGAGCAGTTTEAQPVRWGEPRKHAAGR